MAMSSTSRYLDIQLAFDWGRNKTKQIDLHLYIYKYIVDPMKGDHCSVLDYLSSIMSFLMDS